MNKNVHLVDKNIVQSCLQLRVSKILMRLYILAIENKAGSVF